ncbi:hypothetical protein CDL12_15713 [Handroanthus impetiginosus]|uniref:RING-type E3 ubiquitin transferase n=1 Tax=Handroanthus impetiginosus TaxID=429701 RepID=A0A2G9H2G0_9LAMI|nr:hypothetical protein CDL12_15713 [Handroanthus impetiginosus]
MDQYLNTISLLFLLLHFISLIDVNAQNPSDSAEDSIIKNFEPSLAIVIGLLSIIFSLAFILLLYAKFCHRTMSPNNTTHQIQDGLLRARPHLPGIDKRVLETLPLFRFSWLRGSREGLECAVCLARFEDIEVLRLLPKCKHAFHIDCIGQWLEQHSTCPICRQTVGPDDFLHLPYSNSFRFLWNQQTESRDDPSIQLYVQRDENCHGNSKFYIGSSFEIIDPDPLHGLNHKINVVSEFMLKNRWSNLSSSDLTFLNSEMLNDVSSARFSCLDSRNQEKSIEIKEGDQLTCFSFQGLQTASDSKQNSRLESKAVRSMSEIIVHPRFITEMGNRDSGPIVNDVKEERMRRLWIPIARKTVQWFANGETRISQCEGLTAAQNL